MARVIAGTVLLAARTTRSQAYIQGLGAAGLLTQELIIYGSPGRAQGTPAGIASRPLPGVFLPDFTEPIELNAVRAGWRPRLIDADALDADALLGALRGLAPRLIVFSGYPAQLVPAALTAIAPVLHCHSGELPRYRGSTTLYYALLDGRQPAVTALLVDAGIDSGRIVGMQHYPPPPAGMDIDHVYDGAIRADLLRTVLDEYDRQQRFPGMRAPSADPGRLHYIVHPVLKHIALASLETTPS